MAAKKGGRAGHHPARPHTDFPARQADENARLEISDENHASEDTKVMPSYGLRTQNQIEGVTVIGEAVRRIASESAEFLIEVTSTAPTAAQALRDNQAKTTQITQAAGQLGVGQGDIQVISLKVQNLYSPVMPSLPGLGMIPQIGQPGASPYATSPYGAGTALQPEIQFGSHVASALLRVNVRDPARIGEVTDVVARSGATIASPVRFRPGDEINARKAALEAAAKDAKMKAETIASASGKKVGEPVAISEEFVATNGMYSAARATMPFAFGAGAPDFVGELEYYARVSASFRFA